MCTSFVELLIYKMLKLWWFDIMQVGAGMG